MFKQARPFFMVCETPLHAGSGNDLGLVDLPIQRERHTNFPKVEASGLKGSIREAFESRQNILFRGKTLERAEKKKAISLAFGPDRGDLHAGALGFTDARLLLFPVRSMRGVFAWVTCPEVVERMQKDLTLCGVQFDFEKPQANSTSEDCKLFINDNKIILEEYTFEISSPHDANCASFANWLAGHAVPLGEVYSSWRNSIKQKLVVLGEDDFRDFVQLSTEVITRTKINNNTGTVEPTALFNEEYLPVDSVLYSLALATPIFHDDKGPFRTTEDNEEELVLEFFAAGVPEVIQLGGNATIGKGLVRINKLEVI
ncbi:MAG: type III-B CRISPR module RAMP protein Cmr4 [Bacillota bacterium]